MAVSAQGPGNRDHLQISSVIESGSRRHSVRLVGRYVAVMSAFCLARNVRNRGVVVLVFVLFTVVLFFLFRQRNSSRAAFHTGDEGAAMVCGQRNGDAIARQQRRGKLFSEVVCALPYLSHYSLKYIVSCFSPHVGNGSAGEQTSADQYLHSPSKGGVSRLGWSRGASPSAGKKKKKRDFFVFFFFKCLWVAAD
jgi:hypothetical protein